ncbi:monovalent cation/H(+) antiporter subunit G [Marinicella sp. S1101]|uniref:monovalent cation/H(+) antiporter subunit G n=1 Tax=Marinicella marina TaxID=2996016 RepID=UPI002260C4E0|nr:monovalent cation/H(+) antiporter subunit G [Marinicella marina]MCX7555058.1 monovalent cation/H(+) antiporter subunit G [Marinicella marina]MDJ1141366.1 monovalent cation/H(+) antiporter subunit G [Marinicella marina]
MDMFLAIASGICLLLGSFLILTGGIGLIRFPDFFTRMHAAGITDTLATTLILVGLMLLNPGALVVFKLVAILLLILLIGPTASHALAKAAIRSGLKPLVKELKDEEEIK